MSNPWAGPLIAAVTALIVILSAWAFAPPMSLLDTSRFPPRVLRLP